MLKLGYKASAEQFAPKPLLDFSVEAERNGFDSVFISDHFQPWVVAQVFGTLGVMFPGRVILGVGTGEGLNEVPSTGMKWPETKERFARLREALTLIRRLWTEDRLSFEGEYYRTESATIYDKPKTPVPIYVAGAGPQVAKYAGRMSDGFICTSGKSWDLYTKTLLPNVEEGLA